MKNKILNNLPIIFVCLVFAFGMILIANHAKAEDKSKYNLQMMHYPMMCGLPADVDKYMDSDPELIKQLSKVEYYQVMINYLDSILKNINNRTFQIKNAIEWQKFIRGYSD